MNSKLISNTHKRVSSTCSSSNSNIIDVNEIVDGYMGITSGMGIQEDYFDDFQSSTFDIRNFVDIIFNLMVV